MSKFVVYIGAIITTVMVAAGCASKTSPLTTGLLEAGYQDTGQSADTAALPLTYNEESYYNQTILWGFWDFTFDPATRNVGLIPNRGTMFTANVVKFLDNHVTGLKLKINSLSSGPGYVNVDMDITISHPLNQAGFDGYDVRGIFIGNGSETLMYNQDAMLTYAVDGIDQYLVNADGYTRWFNPTEFGIPGLFGYTQGKFATSAYIGTATLNPYKYFGDGLGAKEDLWSYMNSGGANLGTFFHGTENTRNYRFRFPAGSPAFKHGYAVVANWQSVTVHPSHAPESQVLHLEDNSTLYYYDASNKGGMLILDLSLQGWAAQPVKIIIESTVLSADYILSPSEMNPTGGNSVYSTYHTEIMADNVTGTENQYYWVIAEYLNHDYSNPFGVQNDAENDPLTTFSRRNLTLLGPCPGWVRPLGGGILQVGWDVTVDSLGNAFMVGSLPSAPGASSFLAKYESCGTLLWDRQWGQPGTFCIARGVSVDSVNNIYVAGWFDETADFNPDGGGTHTSQGVTDVYVSKFNPDGEWQWTNCFGGSEGEGENVSIAVQTTDRVFIAGWFSSNDFDPGDGSLITPKGLSDPFLVVLDSNGAFQWAKTWGSSSSDMCQGCAVDSTGKIYVTGCFGGNDFDPGDGSLWNTNGLFDPFLSVFNSTGTFQYARQWGGSGNDKANSVATDGTSKVYIAGQFCSADFNPGDGGSWSAPLGNCDGFLAVYSLDGSFEWAKQLTGTQDEMPCDVTANSAGRVYIGGGFTSPDFNPGDGSSISANASLDSFFSVYDSVGTFQFARTWGGTQGDEVFGISAMADGSCYSVGVFSGTTNFAPGGAPCFESPCNLTASPGGTDAFITRYLPDGCW